jgi:Ca2+-binding EF-hand superfamily protein
MLGRLGRATHFSAAELTRLQASFREICGDAGHSLSCSKFEQVALQVLPNLPSSYLTRVFTLVNEDGSGSINFKEMVCALSPLCRGTLNESVKLCFNAYNSCRSGYLIVSELEIMLEDMHSIYSAPSQAKLDESQQQRMANVAQVESFGRELQARAVANSGQLSFTQFEKCMTEDQEMLQLLIGSGFIVDSSQHDSSVSGADASSGTGNRRITLMTQGMSRVSVMQQPIIFDDEWGVSKDSIFGQTLSKLGLDSIMDDEEDDDDGGADGADDGDDDDAGGGGGGGGGSGGGRASSSEPTAASDNSDSWNDLMSGSWFGAGSGPDEGTADGTAGGGRQALKVVVYEAQGLPDIQLFGTQDPYVRVSLVYEGEASAAQNEGAASVRCCAVDSGGTDPSWVRLDSKVEGATAETGSVLRLPLSPELHSAIQEESSPPRMCSLLLEIWNENAMTDDEIIGSTRLRLTAGGLGTASVAFVEIGNTKWYDLDHGGRVRCHVGL